MEQFKKNNLSTVNIKVVKGTILPNENEMTDNYELFYWANFIPHFNNKTTLIVGECGFDTVCEKNKFTFEYNSETDTIFVNDTYRNCLCSPELYEKYYTNIHYNDNKKQNKWSIPWIRFPRTKDGISIPLLIERILGKIPDRMIFS